MFHCWYLKNVSICLWNGYGFIHHLSTLHYTIWLCVNTEFLKENGVVLHFFRNDSHSAYNCALIPIKVGFEI